MNKKTKCHSILRRTVFRPFIYGLIFCCFLTGCSSGQEILITGTRTLQSEESKDAESSAAPAILDSSDDSDSQNYISENHDQGSFEDSQADEIIVYVCGAVNTPGVVHLGQGARIYEAIELAGGFRKDADREFLNLAEPVRDGERLTVLTLEESAELSERKGALSGAGDALQAGMYAGSGASAGGTSDLFSDSSSLSRISSSADSSSCSGAAVPGGAVSSSLLVNLNTASREELMTLPGIGESKADAIIRYRNENGPFLSPQDLMNISGIKEATYSGLKDQICV